MKRCLLLRKFKASRLLQCYIQAIPTFIRNASFGQSNKISERFEMCFRRMLKFDSIQKVTYEEVLQRFSIIMSSVISAKKRKLRDTNRKRQVAYLGHVFRLEGCSLLQLIVGNW